MKTFLLCTLHNVAAVSHTTCVHVGGLKNHPGWYGPIPFGGKRGWYSRNLLFSLYPFQRLFSRWIWVSRCLLKQRMMEVVVTTGAISRASSSQIITTNKPTSSFLQAGCPSCHPTNSVRALKGKKHTTPPHILSHQSSLLKVRPFGHRQIFWGMLRPRFLGMVA